ncbi:hypothetical protein PJI74_01100 [Mycobacterium kansasii]
MSAAIARRVAALQARADHPATPAHEAAACRELLSKLALAEPRPDRCGLCTRLAADPDPQYLARWQSLRRRGYVRCEFGCAP